MVTFFQWTRETRPTVSMGWLESARRSAMADRFAEAAEAGGRASGGPVSSSSVSSGPMPSATASAQARRPGGRSADVDEDEDQLEAYNAYLARINSPGRRESDPAGE
jgi:hypothetical protein